MVQSTICYQHIHRKKNIWARNDKIHPNYAPKSAFNVSQDAIYSSLTYAYHVTPIVHHESHEPVGSYPKCTY